MRGSRRELPTLPAELVAATTSDESPGIGIDANRDTIIAVIRVVGGIDLHVIGQAHESSARAVSRVHSHDRIGSKLAEIAEARRCFDGARTHRRTETVDGDARRTGGKSDAHIVNGPHRSADDFKENIDRPTDDQRRKCGRGIETRVGQRPRNDRGSRRVVRGHAIIQRTDCESARVPRGKITRDSRRSCAQSVRASVAACAGNPSVAIRGANSLRQRCRHQLEGLVGHQRGGDVGRVVGAGGEISALT